MKALIIFFLTSSIYFSSYAQDPQLFGNTWYLQNVIIDGENNYPMNSTFNGELYINSVQLNGVHNYCESGFAGDVLYVGITQFILSDIDVLAESCVDPDVLQFIGKHYSVYFDNNLIPKNPLDYDITLNGSSNILTVNNPEGNKAIYISEPLNVQSFKNQLFTIYPNPTNETLIIASTNKIENLKIQMFSAEGKLLSNQNFEFEKEISIDVLNIPNGIYFLKIEDERGRVEVKKIIKQ